MWDIPIESTLYPQILSKSTSSNSFMFCTVLVHARVHEGKAQKLYNKQTLRFAECQTDSLQITFANSILAPLAIAMSKASIFLLLLQVFSVNKGMRRAIYAGLIANAIIYTPNLIVSPILGAPHAGETWTDVLLSQRTINEKWLGTYQGPFAVLLDIYIFILPLPVLKNLNMPGNKRIKLFILFGTAFL